jgi:hypothetical protein
MERFNMRWTKIRTAGPIIGLALALAACERTPTQLGTGAGRDPGLSAASAAAFATFSDFVPLDAQATCVAPPSTLDGFAGYQPFALPAGYAQRIIASEIEDFAPVAGSGADLPDMVTLNETGPHAGRFLYRTHEVGSNGAVTVTDLATGTTALAAQAQHYERLDGIAWTPWRTVLFAEEATAAARRDPAFPSALRGLVYELDPASGVAQARPAVGSRSHEGLRFDPQGNLYGISESNPGLVFSGGIFKFVPDRPGDLSSGQLYALRVLDPARTGEAVWVALDRDLSQIDADAAAVAAGATGWARPEDVEIGTSTGNNRGGQQVLYVAVTGEDLVLRIELDGDRAYVSNYVQHVPGFDNPDNLGLDPQGNLYIAEDNTPGDVWVALAGPGGARVADRVVRFASLSDCSAEPTGIYFDRGARRLLVHVQHAGGALRNDLAMEITKEPR